MLPDKGGGGTTTSCCTTSCCTLHIGCLLHTLLLHTLLHTQYLHYTLLHSLTTAQQSSIHRAVHRACLHICTTFLKTENCHFQMQIQLSRNFQNLHSNTLLVCYNDNISMKGLARMNIWSKNLQELHRVEEIFYKRLVRVKSAFSDVLVCPNCSKYSFVSELSRMPGQDAQIEFLFFAKCSCKRLNSTFKISSSMATPPCSLQKLC